MLYYLFIVRDTYSLNDITWKRFFFFFFRWMHRIHGQHNEQKRQQQKTAFLDICTIRKLNTSFLM